MKLLNKLTLKNLRLNKVRTIVTIVGIMLSAALITVVSGMALSGRQTMIDAQKTWSGDYDVSLDIIDTAKIDEIRQNRNVENAYYKEIAGYAKEQLANGKDGLYSVIAMSKNAFDGCFYFSLKEGRFPDNADEAVVTKNFTTPDGKTVKVGDKITFDMVILTNKDGSALDLKDLYTISSNDFKECSVKDEKPKTYTVTGITEDPNTGELYAPMPSFRIFTVSDEKAPAEAIRTKHMNTLYVAYTSESEGDYVKNTADILGFNIDENDESQDRISEEHQKISGVNGYSFNTVLLSMKGYGSSDATNTVIFSLAVIIIIIVMLASVFVIRNSFAI